MAGGLGTRLSEETGNKPKPMVRVGQQPMLFHVMSIYASQGFTHFIVAAGYKMEVISDWVKSCKLPWIIDVVDTGHDTQTGGRLKKILDVYPDNEFFATYGDGLANVNLKDVYRVHKRYNAVVTVTAVRPPARFGVLEISNHLVTRFGEKAQVDAGWINGGFFVIDRATSRQILGDYEPFETGALARLVQAKGLYCYRHEGFWQPMDTLREKMDLELYLQTGNTPWLDGIQNGSKPGD